MSLPITKAARSLAGGDGSADEPTVTPRPNQPWDDFDDSARPSRVDGRASVDIGQETETAGGWKYEVLVRRPGQSQTSHSVSLSWVDHDYWSGGRLPPSQVVEAVLRYALEHDGHPPSGSAMTWPAQFDAARIRRWFPRMDEELRLGA